MNTGASWVKELTLCYATVVIWSLCSINVKLSLFRDVVVFGTLVIEHLAKKGLNV